MCEKKKISFLFGAGISVPAGLPVINSLNNIMRNDFFLDDNCKIDSSCNTFPLNKKYNKICLNHIEWDNLLKSFYSYLENEIRCYNPNVNVNYEMVLNLIMNLTDDSNIEFGRVRCHLEEILKCSKYAVVLGLNLDVILEIIENSIKINLFNNLKNFSCTCYLTPLIKFIEKENNDYKILGISTLNNDYILETVLKNNGISFVDGFRKMNNNEDFDYFQNYDDRIQIFDKKEFNKQNSFKLLKLHGSINWFILGCNTEKIVAKTIAYLKINETEIIKNINDIINNENKSITIEPEILIGTSIKQESYNYGLNLRLVHEFQNMLDLTDILIVSGFSFGDTAVTLRIFDWLRESDNNSIIINDTKDNKDQFINETNQFVKDRLKNRFYEQIKYIDNGVCNLSMDTILNLI